MKSAFGPAVAVAFLAGAAAASAQQAAQPDTVVREGVTIKCRITKATYQLVTYTPEKGPPVTVKGSEIQSITFGDEPMALASARNAARASLPDKALVKFEEALKDVDGKKARDWNKAPILLYWGDFLSDRGDVMGALAMLKRIRTECGDSWWRPESYRKAFEVAKAKGIETQKEVLTEMKAEPEPLASEAKMGLAELAATRNEHDEALTIYREVAGTSGSPQADAAKMGVFRTLKLMKKSSDLDEYSKKLLDDASTTPALQQAAGAWAAGSMLEKAGKDRVKIRAAIFAAGKAIAMGPPDRKEEAEDYVAALRVSAKAYAAMAAEAAKPEQKEEYKVRASGYLMEIVRAYRGTPWAEAASLELQALGVKEN